MKRLSFSEVQSGVATIRHALRMGASHDEYVAVTRKYSAKAEIHLPLGEAISTLAGHAGIWRMRGELSQPQPITERDSFNAQGLEGKVIVNGHTLYDAFFYASQTGADRINIYA